MDLKHSVIIVCLLGLAFAAPPPISYSSNSKDAKTLLYENNNTGFGSYRFAYKQSDGTKHEQQGDLVDEGRENARLVVSGKYTFIAPDGVVYTVRYIADENGYQPEIEKSEQKQKEPDVPRAELGLLIPSLLG